MNATVRDVRVILVVLVIVTVRVVVVVVITGHKAGEIALVSETFLSGGCVG